MPVPDVRARGRARVAAWLRHWGPLLPLLLAVFIVMLGFGAMIPVLPLFVAEQGIDAATLGLIVAGWAIGRLVFEPPFGWWADSHAKKPQMVLALAIVGLASSAMLLVSSPLLLFALRFLAGMGSGMFGPAARGSIIEATAPGSRGQAFGYLSAFQMSGFVLGPAIGAFGAAIFGGYAFPFVAVGVLGLASALVLWRLEPDEPHVAMLGRGEAAGDVRLTRTGVHSSASIDPPIDEPGPGAPSQAPLSALLNRTLVAAVIFGFGSQLTIGLIDTVWPLYLVDLGSSIEWVGITFMLIGLPSIVLAPVAGRYIDRLGPIVFVMLSFPVLIATGLLWAAASEPSLPSALMLGVGVVSTALNTALFAMVAIGAPQGRASLAQGVFGSAATMSVILAAVLAGALWELGRGYPFVFFAAAAAVSFVLGVLAYTGILGRIPRRPEAARTAA
jgi:MFS family permease